MVNKLTALKLSVDKFFAPLPNALLNFLPLFFPFIFSLTSNLSFSADPGVFNRATALYGSVIVEEGTFTAKSTTLPWSSYWFPTKDPLLFKGDNSPLRKYDRFVEFLTGKNPEAAKYAEEKLYDPEAVSWSGLCNTWSLVSILEPEPPSLVKFKIGPEEVLEFTSGDLKALLIQTYTKVEEDKEDIFGQRFDGVYDSVYADIYPSQFHRLLQVQLFDRKLPLIIDIDPGIEVWNQPIWYAKISITSDQPNATVVHVTTDVYLSGNKVAYDFRGVKTEWRRYTYDLSGIRAANGKLLVENGVWTGHSITEHPDYVRIRPTKPIIRASFNEKIDPKIVDMIIKGEAPTNTNQ